MWLDSTHFMSVSDKGALLGRRGTASALFYKMLAAAGIAPKLSAWHVQL